MKYIIILTLSLFGSQFAVAQIGVKEPPKSIKAAGPTFEETTRWITNKFATTPSSENSNGYDVTQKRYIVDFDGCMMNVLYKATSVINSTGAQGVGDGSFSRIPLEKMDPISISIRTWGQNSKGEDQPYLELWTIGRKSLIQANLYGLPDSLKDAASKQRAIALAETDQHRYSKDKQGFWFSNIEDAESMKKALKHVIELCVQAEATKRVETPKVKDLF